MNPFIRILGAILASRRVLRALLIMVFSALLVLPVAAQTARNYSGPNMSYAYEGPRVKFEDIYANPTDRDLNLNYARQQAASGDLIGAASALERLLYAEPNWHSVRLFYAGVLYRLDDKEAATREIMLLDNEDLTPNQITQLANYKSAFSYIPPVTAAAATGQNIAEIEINRSEADMPISVKKTGKSQFNGLNGRFSLGARADTNPGQLLADIVTGLPERADTSAFLTGAVRATGTLSKDKSIYGFASANGQLRRYSDTPRADFSTIGFQTGLYTLINEHRLAASYTADRVYISGEKYFTQTGPNVSVIAPLSPSVDLTGTAEFYDQRFNGLSFAPLETLRTGKKQIFTASLSKKLSSGLKLHGGVGIEFKDAKIAELQYRGLRYNAGFDKAFDNGWTTDGRITIRSLDYDAAAATPIFNRDNEDRLNSRFAIAAPLSRFLPNRDINSNLYVEAGLNYDRRVYSDARTDFNNVGADVRLKWEF
ncbi:surface lipoprotein assembly modifier [Robiginitomaculum antarcticum]|uniref:surface lipoprotein assembly modifier n=1 Tax=Robiginitomaculum antarcticum TaxID=437507 RepID=UPI0003677BC4|nr:surface lipoprotein assembly modifier [Robiginitomaculum antarcticum]